MFSKERKLWKGPALERRAVRLTKGGKGGGATGGGVVRVEVEGQRRRRRVVIAMIIMMRGNCLKGFKTFYLKNEHLIRMTSSQILKETIYKNN